MVPVVVTTMAIGMVVELAMQLVWGRSRTTVETKGCGSDFDFGNVFNCVFGCAALTSTMPVPAEILILSEKPLVTSTPSAALLPKILRVHEFWTTMC